MPVSNPKQTTGTHWVVVYTVRASIMLPFYAFYKLFAPFMSMVVERYHSMMA